VRYLVILGLLISMFASVVIPARVSAATPVTVRVTIKRVIADDSFDSTSDADFYARVWFASDLQTTSPVDGDDSPSPNWQLQTTIDYDQIATLPIRVSIWEDDGGLNFGDDHADINAIDGKADIDLTLHLDKVPCYLDGDLTGKCGFEFDSLGQGDDAGDGEARIIFQVDVLNTFPDVDGDGIPNDWEQNGVTLNGQFIDLPAMGADPNKPDIFIHVDWMQDATHNQALSSAAIKTVVTSFANSPYVSPTGSVGINMHVDQGPGSILNFTTNATWGALSKAQSVPWQNNIGTLDSSGNYVWAAFDAIKSSSFEPTGRSPIFHYVIAAWLQEPPPAPTPANPSPTQSTSSGISRNQTDFANGTSDYLITLGGTGGPGSQQQQSGTLMHELGHNLGLMHGGFENDNFKPNYFSIMNYLYQMRGLDVAGTAGVVNYSTGALAPLNEGALNEANALGVAGIGTGSRCPVPPPPPGVYSRQWTVNANGPFDWNCNGVATDGVVSFDANGNGALDGSLKDYNDWANIKLRVGQIGDLGDANLPMTSPTEPAVPLDVTPPTTTAQISPTPTSYGWNKSSATVTLHAVDNAGGSGVRDITYSASGAQTIGSTNVPGDTATFVISNEGVTTITFSARDNELNVETAKSLTVSVDLTLPDIALGTAYPAANAAGWNNTDVNVPFTATDGPSGIASTTPAASPLVLTTEGTAVTGTITAVDKADNLKSVTTPAFKIDKTPPVVTVTSPTPNQVLDSDQTLTPVFGATDALSGVKSVVGVFDTGQVVTSGTTVSLGLLVGHRTLTVTATDVADNVTTVNIPFRVRPVFVGVAFNDPNESAMREAGEAGMSGVTVFLDNNGDGLPDAGEPGTVTGIDGAYRVVGEDVGPARICTGATPSGRVRTTSRCQTVIVATGIPVPHIDFGSKTLKNGVKNGGLASVIQSIALAGNTSDYWRPADLNGTATGPWAGSRLSAGDGSSLVQVQAGERMTTGLFVGGVDASQVDNLVLSIQYQPNHQTLIAVVAADGSVATAASDPSTSFSYSQHGNILEIYGVPTDGLGSFQDVWVVTEVQAGNGRITTVAGIDGTVVVKNGKAQVKSLGNPSNDQTQSDRVSGQTGTRSNALLVDDVPDRGGATNPF
jgi:hypothetical protein